MRWVGCSECASDQRRRVNLEDRELACRPRIHRSFRSKQFCIQCVQERPAGGSAAIDDDVRAVFRAEELIVIQRTERQIAQFRCDIRFVITGVRADDALRFESVGIAGH